MGDDGLSCTPPSTLIGPPIAQVLRLGDERQDALYAAADRVLAPWVSAAPN
jgi:hypothetical protein